MRSVSTILWSTVAAALLMRIDKFELAAASRTSGRDIRSYSDEPVIMDSDELVPSQVKPTSGKRREEERLGASDKRIIKELRITGIHGPIGYAKIKPVPVNSPYSPPHHDSYQYKPVHDHHNIHVGQFGNANKQKEDDCCFSVEQMCEIFDTFSPVDPPPDDNCPDSTCFCPRQSGEKKYYNTQATRRNLASKNGPYPPKPYKTKAKKQKSVQCFNIVDFCLPFGCSAGTNPCMSVTENCCPGWCSSGYTEQERCTAFNAVLKAGDDGNAGGSTCEQFKTIICPDETGTALVCDGTNTNTDNGEPGYNFCRTYLPETFVQMNANDQDAINCFDNCIEAVDDSADVTMDISCCCGISP